MKRKLFTLIFMLAAISTFAQISANVSGNVFNQANGNPVPNHEVYIFTDSTMNANGFYYSNQVFTDANGYFNVLIPLDSLPSGYYTTGTLKVGTYDCNNWLFDNDVTFMTGVYNLSTSFSICVPTGCNAIFYSFTDTTFNTVDFSDYSSGNINSWYWDFGDGTTSTLQNPVHTFPNSGNFNVCMTISELDTNGTAICTDTYCENTAVGICVASFSSYTDSINNTVDFYDYSTGTINSWSWDFGDGTTSTLQNPVHTFANSGYYNVCLTASHHDLNGLVICTDTYCANTAVNVPTTPDYFCDVDFYHSQSNPGIIDFTDASFANLDGVDVITSWTWTFGDGTTSNLQSPSHTYSHPGVYNAALTIFTAEGCSSYLEMSVDADTVASGACHSDFEVYLDYNLPFTYYFQEASLSEDPNQIINSASWDFGDGSTSTIQSPTHTFLQGVYHICHTITTTTGCSSTYCENLTIDSACYIYVFATSIINETTAGSHNGTIALSVIGTPPFTFNWSNGATTQTVTGLTSGYYNVWVNDANGCQTWATFDILVNADSLNWNYNDTLITNPVDTCFNFQPASASIYNYIFHGTDSVTITWIVFDITGTLHGFTTDTYLYDSTGYYVVLLSVTCDSAKAIHHFYDKLYIRAKATGISQTNDARENIILYPIPVADKLNISFILPRPDAVTINILNVTGQIIHSEKLNYSGGQSMLTVNTASFASGLYFVQMNYNGKNKMLKFVK